MPILPDCPVLLPLAAWTGQWPGTVRYSGGGQFFLNIRQIFIAADGQILNTNNLAIYGHTGLGIPLIHPSCKSVGTP